MSEMTATSNLIENAQGVHSDAAEFEQVLQSALRLSPRQKAQLAEKLIHDVTQLFEVPKPRRSLHGVLKEVSISAEEIDEAQHEMWGNFPREDF
jgi:hypothetical protein